MDFFKQVIKDLKKTGAIAPSSKFLARDLVDQLKCDLNRTSCPPLNILELGPGTGPLTKEIIKLLRPADHMDIVEVQKNFFEIIDEKFSSDNISAHLADILHFEPTRSYDYIFSSLPYENMPAATSRRIWEKKLSLCKQNSYICYFKYVKFRNFKSDFEEKVVDEYEHDKKFVLRNIPPAKLYTLQIDKKKDTQKSMSDKQRP